MLEGPLLTKPELSGNRRSRSLLCLGFLASISYSISTPWTVCVMYRRTLWQRLYWTSHEDVNALGFACLECKMANISSF